MRSAGPWLRRTRAVPMQPRVHAGTIAYRSLTQPSAPPAALPVSPRAGLDPRGPFRSFWVPESEKAPANYDHAPTSDSGFFSKKNGKRLPAAGGKHHSIATRLQPRAGSPPLWLCCPRRVLSLFTCPRLRPGARACRRAFSPPRAALFGGAPPGIQALEHGKRRGEGAV